MTCDDCKGPIGQDCGPPDGWQMEDGRIICHACCVADTRRELQKRKANKRKDSSQQNPTNPN